MTFLENSLPQNLSTLCIYNEGKWPDLEEYIDSLEHCMTSIK